MCQFQFIESPPLCYVQQKRFNSQCSDISRGLGDGVRIMLISDRDRGLVRHVCSYHVVCIYVQQIAFLIDIPLSNTY